MKHHIDWPDERRLWPVWVEVGNSAEEILAAGYLTTELKASNAKAVGVVLDADFKAHRRYQRIQQLCGSVFPNLPNQMPESGLIVQNSGEKRFGLWLMPNNSSPGDLETFLAHLVPQEQSSLWTSACESVAAAIAQGAPCRSPHLPKANLYTWLAWQDPPGYSPGIALTKKILDPQSSHSKPFVQWFKDLYQL